MIHPCEFPLYSCEQPAILRVRLWGPEGHCDYDLCRPHVHHAASEFPDNITTEREYPMSNFNNPGDPTKEVQAVFTRSEILELMGECALPPFYGHPEANDWPIAPMANRVIAEVDRAFAKKLPGGTHTPGVQVKPKSPDAGFER